MCRDSELIFRKSDLYLVALFWKMICSLGDLVSLRHPVAQMDVSRLIYIHATCFMRKCVTRLIYVAFLIHVTRLMYVALLFRKSDLFSAKVTMYVALLSFIQTRPALYIHV